MFRSSVVLYIFLLFSCVKNKEIIIKEELVKEVYIQNIASNLQEKVVEYERVVNNLNQMEKIPITKYRAHSLIIFHYKDGTKLKVRTDFFNVGPIGKKFYRSSKNILE